MGECRVIQTASGTDQDSNSNEHRFESIEDRLNAIEAQLSGDAAADQAIPNDDQNMAESSVNELPIINIMDPPERPTNNDDSHVWSLRIPKDLYLPPFEEIELLITFFKHGVNEAVPIFSAHRNITGLVEDWYHKPTERTKVSWSAINIILALALRYGRREDPSSLKIASTCISNAQSAMDSLVYRDSDLTGLRVVLGLAMVFMTTPHPQPACVLIATAVKLVHRLKIHTKSNNHGADTEEGEERESLYWITYAIDRDLSLRTHEPYLLQDRDTDLDIHDMSDSGGMMLRDQGKIVHLVKFRAQLAAIQGNIYDSVHSVRAAKLLPDQKDAAIRRLDKTLEEWYNSLPACFKADKAKDLRSFGQRHCVLLHMTYYHCLFSLRKVSICNRASITRLIKYSEALRGYIPHERISSDLLLPSNLPNLVTAARSCIRLLGLSEGPDAALLWSSMCAFEAAITVLSTKNLTVSEHNLRDLLDADASLLKSSMVEFKYRLGEIKDSSVLRLYAGCEDLVARAEAAVVKFRENNAAQQS
ncbi:hypothetical protein ACHAPI_010831 [Fusarium lateritium]